MMRRPRPPPGDDNSSSTHQSRHHDQKRHGGCRAKLQGHMACAHKGQENPMHDCPRAVMVGDEVGIRPGGGCCDKTAGVTVTTAARAAGKARTAYVSNGALASRSSSPLSPR